MSLILGLETSCDETAAAVVQDGVLVRSNVIATQHKLHERYGGVVPEIASRAHLERISPVITEALAKADATFDQLDAIAVGNRPGLIGSLLVGVNAAKALAWSLGKPLVGVDHVKAHLYAGVMVVAPSSGAPSRQGGALGARPAQATDASNSVGASSDAGDRARMAPPFRDGALELFPALGLVVSGGHTSLYELQSPVEMRVIGRTIDDAVGEAYDKVAVILNVGYPGGPKLDKLAQTGDPASHKLPRSMLDGESLDFSFSGLKTAMLYAVRGHPVGRGSEATFERSADDLSEEEKRNLAAAFQDAAIDTLSANSELRKRATELGKERGLEVRLPPMSLCLDNAAMIAGLAHEQLRRGQVSDLGLEAISTSR